MDPINLLVLINLIVSMSANWGGARKGLKTSITKVVDRPQTYLQKFPPNIAALVLILTIIGVFQLGVLPGEISEKFFLIRAVGLCFFVLFSWIQVWAYRSLGKSYAQDIVILKDHKLITSGPFKFIRHPQYLSQILSDLGAGLALMSFLVVPVVLLLEIPLFVLRASAEDKMLSKYFEGEFSDYKKRSGFMLPFIG